MFGPERAERREDESKTMTSGAVTQHLIDLITKQVADHGIVVWYDPENAYPSVFEQLQRHSTDHGPLTFRFNGSFFELRAELEPLLEFIAHDGGWLAEADAPARAIVYVPLARGDANHALVEAEAAGTVVEPGGNVWQRNSRLRVVAERVFRQLAPDRAEAIGKEIDEGRRSLAELDWLADQTGDLGALKLIYGTTTPAEAVPAFCSSDELDQELADKQALGELAGLARTELGLEMDAAQSVEAFRRALCRAMLLAELAIALEGLGDDAAGLAAVPKPDVGRQREQLLDVLRAWRNRLDRREGYARAADLVEGQLSIVRGPLSQVIRQWALRTKEQGAADGGPRTTDLPETFSGVEAVLLEAAEEWIVAGNTPAATALAQRRKASFWSLQRGEFQLRWTLLELAGLLLAAADRVEEEMKGARGDARAMAAAYVGVGQTWGWQLLDRRHRQLEHRYATLELRLAGSHDGLERVMTHCRRRYHEVAGRCAEAFGEALAAGGFELAGTLRQRDIFTTQVRPRLGEGKTAYLLVDALRYEMGQELVEGLGDGFEGSVAPAMAQAPTITEVGMAALVAGADDVLELVDAGGGKVGLKIGGTVLKDRAGRLAWFTARVPEKTIAIKLAELMKPTKKRCQEIAEAELVLVTSQELDRRGEEPDDPEESRRLMDDVFDKLRLGIRRLASLGVRRIIVAADHGHLFVEEPQSDMKLDPPGGRTVDLHPRVWIGKGGSAAACYLRTTAEQLGLAGELELAFPRGLACFRVPGGTRGYFHGGLSLAELIVPVVSIAVRAPLATGAGLAQVAIALAKPRITTRFFSLELKYTAGGLFGEPLKRVAVVVRAGASPVGEAAMAAYGFDEGTREVVLERDRPCAVTMILTAEVLDPAVSVHVLDAGTQMELAVVKSVPVEISI